MSFQPIIPSGGNIGWAFLRRTQDAQRDAFSQSTYMQTQSSHFIKNISNVQSADDLISDHRLLSVALGAFGLSDDINNKYFIKKVLEEGTENDDSFSNRLADKRYYELSKAFGFDRNPPNTALSSFPTEILEQYRSQEFEVAVGNQSEDLRLAMGLERELLNLKEKDLSKDAAWFTIMGTPPIRKVFETALGLPSAIGAIDVDKQLEIFQEKSRATFGTDNALEFDDPELREDLIRNFLLRTELNSGSSPLVTGSIALSILSQSI